MSPLQAGAARVRLAPPLGAPMMGYGLRAGGAREWQEPLDARALYCRSGADREALLIECDLCLIAPAQARAARARLARRAGIAEDRVLLGCTHTHSGPETGVLALLQQKAPPEYVAALFEAAAEAGQRARACAAPARLGLGSARAHIGRNRRRRDGPVDPEVLVVRVDRAEGAPLAVLFVHGCHPTVLGHENLAYSPDWPGAARRRVEAALPGALAIFALGAHADVDPRTRDLMDLAVEGQSLGAGFEAAEALGAEVGEAVAGVAEGIATSPTAEVAAASARVSIPVHGAEAGAGAREQILAERRRVALAALDLDPGSSAGTAELFRLCAERTRALPAEERRERVARVRMYLRDRTAPHFAGGLAPEVEVQLLRLGEARLLGLPAEPTVDVGADWKARAGGPASPIGIANGWLRYLPHPSNFAEPGAERHYEVLMSTLVPEAAERLLAEGERLDAALDGKGRG